MGHIKNKSLRENMINLAKETMFKYTFADNSWVFLAAVTFSDQEMFENREKMSPDDHFARVEVEAEVANTLYDADFYFYNDGKIEATVSHRGTEPGCIWTEHEELYIEKSLQDLLTE